MEDLAAFLDGGLTGAERARVTEHLASCESCYRIFAGTARFLAQSREDDQEQSQPLVLLSEDSWEEPLQHSVSKPLAPRRRPFDRRRARAPRSRGWWAAAAGVAALLIATAGLVVLLQGTRDAGPSTEQLASLVGRPAHEMVPWPAGPRTRGGAGESPGVPLDREEFRLGVRLLDLRLALESGRQDDASEALRLLGLLLDRLDYPAPKTSETYREMRIRALKGDPLPALLAAAPAAEKQALAELQPDPRLVELGRWTEACRLAGASGRADLFRDRGSLRVLDRAIEPGGKDADDLDPAALPAVRAIRDRIAAGRAGPADLGKRCEELLKQIDYE